MEAEAELGYGILYIWICISRKRYMREKWGRGYAFCIHTVYAYIKEHWFLKGDQGNIKTIGVTINSHQMSRHFHF